MAKNPRDDEAFARTGAQRTASTEGPGRATAGPEEGTTQTRDPARSNEAQPAAGYTDPNPAGGTRTGDRVGEPAPNAPMTIDGADDGSQGGPPQPDKQVQLKHDFQVAPGKSITSQRGILEEGQEVKATDFVLNESEGELGQKRLDALVKSGVVLSRSGSGSSGTQQQPRASSAYSVSGSTPHADDAFKPKP